MTVLVFVVTIIILVGVHELGHFLAARVFGVYVHEFSIGMGPILVSRKRGEILYAFRLIPIGGYVRMAGEDRLETGVAIPAERILYNKPPYVRMLISMAGPFMNAGLAFVVLLIVSWSISLPVLQVVETVPNAPAAAVFHPGDRILAIGGQTIYTQSDITRAIAASDGQPLDVQIRRDGFEQTVEVTPREKEDGSGYQVGAYFASLVSTTEIVALSPASALFVAGAEGGDHIVAVEGEPVTTGLEAGEALAAAFAATDPVTITMLRGDARVDVSVRANGRTLEKILDGATFGDLGTESRRAGFRDGFVLGWRNFTTYASLLGRTLRDLVSGSAEARDAISGPIGIADVLGKSLSYGFLVLLEILGFLSLNFAIINLIPFPGLDGSRVVFAVVEWVRRKPIPPQREGIIHAIGFVVMLVLLVLVTYRDIVRLFV
jgi:regulator of sigma E protease